MSPHAQLYTAPFCARLRPRAGAAERAGITFEEIDLSRDLERCCQLEALTGGRSAPQLVLDGRPIGGLAELDALARNGGLRRPVTCRIGSGATVTQPTPLDTKLAASVDEREAAFARAHPRYADTAILDELRRSDFARLDAGGHVYLDYTGAGLYADSQLREHLELLRASVFGNPHSLNPTSAAMTELVERARAAVLEFFRASPEEYVAIFTPNATGALRLVGEAYPFRPGDRFLLTFDNHNSVNGIREFARARGAETTYVPSVAARAARRRAAAAPLPDRGRRASTTTCSPTRRSRTSPASSTRSTGSSRRTPTAGTCCSTRPPTSRPTGSTSPAGTPTSSRSPSTRCSAGRPASAACSPAARRSPSSSGPGSRAARSSPPSSSASGTSPRPARPTSRTAPSTSSTCPRSRSACASSSGSGSRRSTRASRRSAAGCSTRSARSGTADGAPAATIYGPRDFERRGATIAFNFLHPDGRVVDERYVDRVARRHNISLRTGCFCNPGAGEVAFTISRETLVGGEFGDGMTLDDYVARDRAALRRRRPRLARARLQPRRRRPLHARSHASSSTSPTYPTTCRRASAAEPARRSCSCSYRRERAATLTAISLAAVHGRRANRTAPSDSHAVSAEEATSGKMPDALGSRGSLRVLAS